ncbi:MAG: hypothetical protein RBT47_07585 [Anaerolineae bacterium]|jgi:hypothetical protein|nr:hypothetical protein [Anaerolineae bacterium]
MKLICPICGGIASAEAWENDPAARSCLELAVKLPAIVQPYVLQYLGLFRKSARQGLAWSRALRIMRGLVDLVDAGSVQWEGGETRPASPPVWAAALQATLKRGPKGLDNHNYLRRTCWEMAAGEAAKAERAVEEGRRQNTEDRGQKAEDRLEPASEEDLAEMQKMMKQFFDRFGR